MCSSCKRRHREQSQDFFLYICEVFTGSRPAALLLAGTLSALHKPDMAGVGVLMTVDCLVKPYTIAHTFCARGAHTIILNLPALFTSRLASRDVVRPPCSLPPCPTRRLRGGGSSAGTRTRRTRPRQSAQLCVRVRASLCICVCARVLVRVFVCVPARAYRHD